MAKSGKKQNRTQKKASTNNRNKSNKATASKKAPKRSSQMTLTEKIAWWSILAMVFMVPVAMSNLTWLPGVHTPITFDQFDIMKLFLQRFFTLVAFGAWAWHILLEGGKIRRTKVDYLILALLGWVFLTSVLSIHPPTAFFGKYRRFEGFISFFNYAAIFWLVTQFVDRASRVRTIARSLFFSGVVVNFYGIMQYLGVDPISWGKLPFEANRAFSSYGNPDLLGGYLIFPLVISLALALSEENKGWRAVYWAGFLLTVIDWIVAFTRGAWIGGLVALAVLGVVAFLHKIKLNSVDYSFMGASAAAGAVVVARSVSNPNAVLNVSKRIGSIFDFGSGSALSRFQIWEAAWAAIKDRPIFGFGADTFRLVFPKYKPVEYVATAGYLSVADNVHNYPLQITTALGVPGFLLLYGVFGAVAWFSAPTIFKRYDEPDRLLLGAFWAACAGYITHLMFGISVTGSTFLLWVAMAVVLSPVARSIEVKPPKWGVWVVSVVLVLVAALLIGNAVYLAADHYYLKARLLTQDMARVEAVETAIKLNPYNDMYRAEKGLAYTDLAIGYITRYQQTQQETDFKQAELYFHKAEEAYQDVIAFAPYEYDNYVFITNLYNLGAEYIDPAYAEKAVEWGEKGMEVEPFGPAMRFQVARALVRLGRLDEAQEHLEFAVEMDPNYADVALMLADVYREKEEWELAEEWYLKAEELRPGMMGVQEALDFVRSQMETESTSP